VTDRPSSYDAFPLPVDPYLLGEPPVGPPAPPTPPRKKRRRAIRWIVIALVAVLLATGGYVFYNYQRFVSGVATVDVIDQATDDYDGPAQNILLVGDDHRPDNATPEQLALLGTEADGGATLTDTMMVLHLPADGSSASIISFPRDSWVEVPGYGMNKLNSAFSLGGGASGDSEGGAKLLIQTIQNLSGLSIDHYMRVSLLGFYNIADALGPVEVCLNNAVDDPYSALALPAGVSSLNASQALSFVRQRHGLPNGDLDRQVRQQYFLSVEARKILSAGTLLNPVKLGNVLDAVSGAIEADSGLNFIELASQVKNLNADNIHSATIPILGTPTISVGSSRISIVEVDTDAMPAFIDDIIGTPSAYEAAAAAPVGEVTVSVVNGGAPSGAAAAATDVLAGIGFLTTEPSSAGNRVETTIQYPAGQEAQAKAVSAYLAGAAVVEADVSGVTVVLGSDGLTPVAPVAAAPVDPAAPAAPAEETPSGTTYAAGACIN
jgi:LCP family protein required for cell wall assembly